MSKKYQDGEIVTKNGKQYMYDECDGKLFQLAGTYDSMDEAMDSLLKDLPN